MRLNRAMLYVKDFERMAAFYEGTLGLKPVEGSRTDTWLEFDTGGARLALHAIPAHIADQIEISSPPQPREETPLKLMFEVDDVAAECKKLESMGVPLVQRPWGSCDGVDPEGNIFQVYSSTAPG